MSAAAQAEDQRSDWVVEFAVTATVRACNCIVPFEIRVERPLRTGPLEVLERTDQGATALERRDRTVQMVLDEYQSGNVYHLHGNGPRPAYLALAALVDGEVSYRINSPSLRYDNSGRSRFETSITLGGLDGFELDGFGLRLSETSDEVDLTLRIRAPASRSLAPKAILLDSYSVADAPARKRGLVILRESRLYEVTTSFDADARLKGTERKVTLETRWPSRPGGDLHLLLPLFGELKPREAKTATVVVRAAGSNGVNAFVFGPPATLSEIYGIGAVEAIEVAVITQEGFVILGRVPPFITGTYR